MPGYVSVLKSFDGEPQPVRHVLAHGVDTAWKIVFPHIFSTTIAAITAGGKQIPRKRVLTLIGVWISIQVIYWDESAGYPHDPRFPGLCTVAPDHGHRGL
jgi:hypothetical protein